MKKIFFILSAFVFISLSACGPKPVADLVDGNCGVGLKDDEKKPNRYIAAYDGHFNKTKMIMFKVKGQPYRVMFNDDTKWEFKDSPAKDKEELMTKKGSCIAVDFVEKDGNVIATEIKVLPEFKLDKKYIIKQAEMKELVAKGAVLIDSRPAEAFITGTIPDSINIPLAKIKTEEGMKMLPADKSSALVFYCGGVHCKLSPASAMIALKAGYNNLKVYHEGTPDWDKNNSMEVQPAFVKSNIEKKNPMILVDIRKNAASDHIPGAIAIAPADIEKFKTQFPANPNDKKKAPVIIYGADSKDMKEALAVADKITAWGYASVSYMKGGFAAYKKAGGETANAMLAKEIKYVAKPTGEIAPADFISKYTKGEYKNFVFIDVREKSEIDEDKGITLLGAQAKNIPLGELEKNLPSKDGKYIMFCASGLRAVTAKDILAGKGFKDVLYLAGSVESDGKGGLKLGDKVLAADQIKK